MKYELKFEFNDEELLVDIIKKSYFNNDTMGKIKNPIGIKIEKNTEWYNIFKGMHNTIIRVYNKNMIDGMVRFLVEERNDDIYITPCSIYCIHENDKYSFY